MFRPPGLNERSILPTKRFEKLDPDRKAAILQAAANEFATHGYAAASINRIVKAAGTSKGALYYWFEDKEDILATVASATIERFGDLLGEPEEPEDADAFWAWAERFCRDSLRLCKDDPHTIALIQCVLEAAEAGDGRGAVAAYQASLNHWYMAFMGSAIRLKVIDLKLPPSLMLMLLTSTAEALDRWLVTHVHDLSSEELDALSDELIQLYRRMANQERT